MHDWVHWWIEGRCSGWTGVMNELQSGGNLRGEKPRPQHTDTHAHTHTGSEKGLDLVFTVCHKCVGRTEGDSGHTHAHTHTHTLSDEFP